MEVLVEELLEVWREAERVLEQIPDAAPEHELLQFEVARLRDTLHRLSDQRTVRTAILIRESMDRIESARLTLARAKERIDRS